MIERLSEECYQKYYKELLSFWQNQEYEPLLTDETELMRNSPVLSDFLQHSPCVSWVFNLRSLMFDLVSANTEDLFGYEPALFKENGLDFCNQIKHPKDLEKTWKLLRKVWNYIMSIPPDKRDHYKFNYDYRILKPDGREATILEQNAVLQQDNKGNITHILGICNDITSWKNNEEQIASIISTADHSVIFFKPDDLPASPSQPVLSKRELEIVRLLAQGYSSKYIADKLHVSVHTINTHRQNILQKTKSRNTSDVIRFVISEGII